LCEGLRTVFKSEMSAIFSCAFVCQFPDEFGVVHG
jgi:hypothetical protein